MNLSSLSTQYVRIPVTYILNGQVLNPTTAPVYLAFMPPGVNPAPGDWHQGTWDSWGTTYLAKVLVGPQNGGIVLSPGTWTVWVQITENPEVPVSTAGTLTIT